VLSTIIFALYLLVAGGAPVADALPERTVDIGVVETEPASPGDPAAPDHESCLLCTLIDRLPTPVAVAVSVDEPVVSFIAATGWLDPPSAVMLRRSAALSARAPPLAQSSIV
jgi:hypothetical protein